MSKNFQIFMLTAGAVLVLVLVIFYYGFVYSFRNFGGGGKGYPLAVYSLPFNIERTSSIIDSLSKNGSYRIERRTSGGKINYISINSDSINGDITFEFEYLPSTSNDSTTVFLWAILEGTDSITPYSKDNNKNRFNQNKLKFENGIVSKIKFQ